MDEKDDDTQDDDEDLCNDGDEHKDEDLWLDGEEDTEYVIETYKL